MRGYFGIGIEKTKNAVNIGTLWRSANILGASFVFTIGKRYKKQCSDTLVSWRHIPLYHYETIDDLVIPYSCLLIGVELIENAKPLATFKHPQRAIYLLGSEDSGLSSNALKQCHDIIVLPGKYSLNVSVAGSIVMYDRISKV